MTISEIRLINPTTDEGLLRAAQELERKVNEVIRKINDLEEQINALSEDDS